MLVHGPMGLLDFNNRIKTEVESTFVPSTFTQTPDSISLRCFTISSRKKSFSR